MGTEVRRVSPLQKFVDNLDDKVLDNAVAVDRDSFAMQQVIKSQIRSARALFGQLWTPKISPNPFWLLKMLSKGHGGHNFFVCGPIFKILFSTESCVHVECVSQVLNPGNFEHKSLQGIDPASYSANRYKDVNGQTPSVKAVTVYQYGNKPRLPSLYELYDKIYDHYKAFGANKNKLELIKSRTHQ